MAHTVESFVETLRADGVEAGRKAAEEICRQAEADAAQLIRDAEAKAQQIVQEAEAERERTIERTQTDLRLAARDTLAKLRDTLDKVIQRILERAVTETLEDEEFLKQLIRDVVVNYASADSEHQPIDLNVSPEMQHKLADWAIASLHTEAGHPKLPLELHGALSTAGFEYDVLDGTVEVTPESIVQTLSRVVTPELRELIASSGKSD